MKTAVVILNYKTQDYLLRFIPGLVASTKGLDAEVIVADNASTDNSRKVLKEHFPDVKTVLMDQNYGFTGGYNRAIAEISQKYSPEYIVLINTDIEVPQNWLKPLTDSMDAHPECGNCGPLLHRLIKNGDEYIRSDVFEYAGAAGGYIDRLGYPFCRGRVLNRVETDNGQYDSPKNVLWVSGACLMTRTRLWNELGGLDDRFFAHMEEIDYCWRVALAGYTTTVIPDSVVYHIGAGTLPQTSTFKLKLNYRNNLLMLDKNLPRTIGGWRASIRIFARKCMDGLSALAYLLSLSPAKTAAVYQAHKEYRQLKDRKSTGYVHSKMDVCGVQNIFIIPLAILLGNKVFKTVSEL